MTDSSPTHGQLPARASGAGYLFGVPIGDFGWFGSLLIGVGSGFIAFFASTFLAILFILVYNTTAHRNIDFALSYSRIGLPAGIIVMIFALGYLGRLWAKRMLRPN
ncbi:MAG TPA: hypothetical protein VGN01_15500 [Acidobacteriaceae bacterium]|jgi:hypothetical protein